MGFWEVVMEGPPGSPCWGGTFLLHIDTGENFPIRAPTVRFLVPVLHPNVSKQGRICHPIFDREWNSSLHAYQTLEQIHGMLMSIEVSPSRNTTVDLG